ncbi:hypothetical protein B0T21DRAFT_414393 [Apiosordaria backusii]|uniref:Uncharacterized protein n=1 Tax=Apiosordaria backusii TaxID=314023 RepID=A0AA40E192_9PEZI|nr:hypothetical protein B0T21DRAFT_414393 [Apiosordaria backusii]
MLCLLPSPTTSILSVTMAQQYNGNLGAILTGVCIFIIVFVAACTIFKTGCFGRWRPRRAATIRLPLPVSNDRNRPARTPWSHHIGLRDVRNSGNIFYSVNLWREGVSNSSSSGKRQTKKHPSNRGSSSAPSHSRTGVSSSSKESSSSKNGESSSKKGASCSKEKPYKKEPSPKEPSPSKQGTSSSRRLSSIIEASDREHEPSRSSHKPSSSAKGSSKKGSSQHQVTEEAPSSKSKATSDRASSTKDGSQQQAPAEKDTPKETPVDGTLEDVPEEASVKETPGAEVAQSDEWSIEELSN